MTPFRTLVPATALLLAAPLLALPTTDARAQDGHAGTLGECLSAAAQIEKGADPGDFVKVEYLDPSADGVPTFEIERLDADGQEWEFMCDATSGSIYEIEQEAASADDPRFRAEVGVEEAREAVQALYDGEVVELEYEIESDGASTYEIDVRSGDTEWKVEVDARSGEIIEVHVEQWEIGVEEGERP